MSDYQASVFVVSWDENLLKPLTRPSIDNVTFLNRSNFSSQMLTEFIEDSRPHIVYISGWMDSGYMRSVNQAKNRHEFTTVIGLDDTWHGSFRQRIGLPYFKRRLRKTFDKAWVAGSRQYQFARSLGYQDSEIAFNLLSCDTLLFGSGGRRAGSDRSSELRFLYVGNFRYVKGTDLLAEAYAHYKVNLHGRGELTCIGQGELEHCLRDCEGIDVRPFATSTDLIQMSNKFDIFIFPSRADQWGVALHEFALRGFPIIASTGAGATERFLIDGFNGLRFWTGNSRDLALKMKKCESISAETLDLWSQRSRDLGRSITSRMAAASLMSLGNWR